MWTSVSDSELDIIMVNYHTADLVDEFLFWYEKANIQIPHVVTIVDVDQQEPLDVDKKYGIVPTSTNVGYGRACNMGVRVTSSPIIALFNSDVRIHPQSVEKCVEVLRSNPTYGVVGPLQVNENNRITHAGIFGTLKHPRHRGWMGIVRPMHQKIEEAVTVSGSVYFTTRQLWNELQDCNIYRSMCPHSVGAFLETRHYYEETWYSYHAQAHGKKVIYCGEAMMYHGFHKSSPVGSVEKHVAESRRLFRECCDSHGIDRD